MKLIQRALAKGDYIPPDECEKHIKVSRESRYYSLKLLGLASALEKDYFQKTGNYIQIVCSKDGLKVLTDPEASDYNWKATQALLNRLSRALGNLNAVDVGNLDEDQVIYHDKRIISLSRITGFVSREVSRDRKLYAPIYTNDHPKLFEV